MSFYKIPQNYAPGFVPQRYTFINDAAAATLTARLTDTRTAEASPNWCCATSGCRRSTYRPSCGAWPPPSRSRRSDRPLRTDDTHDDALPRHRQRQGARPHLPPRDAGNPLRRTAHFAAGGTAHRRRRDGRGIGTLPHAMLGPPHGDLQRHPDAAHVRRRGRGRRPLPARGGGVPRRGGVRPAPDGRRRRVAFPLRGGRNARREPAAGVAQRGGRHRPLYLSADRRATLRDRKAPPAARRERIHPDGGRRRGGGCGSDRPTSPPPYWMRWPGWPLRRRCGRSPRRGGRRST